MTGDGAPGGLPLIYRFLPRFAARNPHPRQLDPIHSNPVESMRYLPYESNYTVISGYFSYPAKISAPDVSGE